MSPDEDVPHTNPLDRLLRRRSPYDGLFEHATKVAECVRLLDEGWGHYAAAQHEQFGRVLARVGELEHEADKITSRVAAHLPRHIFMSVDRARFEILLHEQDAILDRVEDLAERMGARPTAVPPDLRAPFHELVRAVVATADAYEKAVEMFADVLATGFGEAARDEVKDRIKTVHQREFECDRLRFALLRSIYAMEDQLKPLDVVHLVLFADLLDDVADMAEAAADRLRVLVAR